MTKRRLAVRLGCHQSQNIRFEGTRLVVRHDYKVIDLSFERPARGNRRFDVDCPYCREPLSFVIYSLIWSLLRRLYVFLWGTLITAAGFRSLLWLGGPYGSEFTTWRLLGSVPLLLIVVYGITHVAIALGGWGVWSRIRFARMSWVSLLFLPAANCYSANGKQHELFKVDRSGRSLQRVTQ